VRAVANQLGPLLRDTYAKWNADDGWLYAAAMAAFAALALAPLLVIALRIAEMFGGEQTVLHALAFIIDPIVGHGGVRALNGVAAHAQEPTGGILPTIVAAGIALFGGSRLFYALQRALHLMWNTPAVRRTGAASTVAAFLAAAILAVIVMAGMTVLIFGSAAFVAAAHSAGVHGALASVGARVGIAVLGALLLAPIVATLFRWLAGDALAWGDLWIGAFTTAIGFAFAQLAIGLYLASVNLPWTYGSAASLIVILLWLYYSSYLFLLGAEFTDVYARRLGSLRNVSGVGTFGEKGAPRMHATGRRGGRSQRE
jgi:membrane protein